ncbi:hypothetical protein JJB99_24140 [Bradyrhizobium diazoefficiens]|uniref:hypothetical protein n=1 Tax=Bradyrhizobium diazoefficiens TaxID=1355477 RepID=UPI00190BEFF0|nr:hypothetical protein [Bradyrhizobium diazoefficiens]QQO12546.1 hypothetical protein JJB99_24140 [Bradyrhizobium diazoefficiens]
MNTHVLPSLGTVRPTRDTAFLVLCLWSVGGLMLSALLFVAGFGSEIADILVAAG